MQKQVVVIAGPSGSGETTITNEIVKRFPETARRLVTATTRRPRAGEKNGADYYFLSEEDFARAKERGDILESTFITNRNTYYGTYAPDLNEKIASKKIVIANPDIVGARYFKEHFNAVTIFIVPESIDALERRIRERNPELPEAEVAKRRVNAEAEIRDEAPFYDYQVTNADGKLEKAVDEVVVILKKEGYLEK
ncbi:MAG: guanylate kinase [bacterium]|nr:guanylate kinase [bacterium]